MSRGVNTFQKWKIHNNPVKPHPTVKKVRLFLPSTKKWWRFLQCPPGTRTQHGRGCRPSGPAAGGGHATPTTACLLHRGRLSSVRGGTAALRGRVRDSDPQLGIGPRRRMELEKRTSGRDCVETACGSSVHGESTMPEGQSNNTHIRTRARGLEHFSANFPPVRWKRFGGRGSKENWFTWPAYLAKASAVISTGNRTPDLCLLDQVRRSRDWFHVLPLVKPSVFNFFFKYVFICFDCLFKDEL